MSDSSKSESTPSAEVVPPATTPAEPAVVEPVATEVAEPVTPAPVVVEKKKSRAVGAWSFVLGLLTVLVDIAFVIWVVVVLVGAIGDLTSGNLQAISTAISAAGLVIIALLVFFGAFVSAGLAVLLGVVGLISGRGRVLAVFGLLFGVVALLVRIGLLSAGFSPDLG
jgi:hypothetical protein